MSGLAVGAVMCAALGIWVYAQLQSAPMPTAAPICTKALAVLGTPAWLSLLVLLTSAIPLVFACGLLISRPLSRQFSAIAKAARCVARGDFSARAVVSAHAPQELAGLADDFNHMTHRLETYEQAVKDSSAQMAHELRTPLNAAMGRIQGMVDAVFPRSNEQLLLVHRQLQQINRLVGDLHLLSIARAGVLSLERECFALADLVDERIQWVERDLAEAGITCRTALDRRVVVNADRVRLGQVITIIVDNLLRHAASGRTMDVALWRSKTGVCMSIADRGPGVGTRTRAPYCGGSGLGLSIAAAICSAHGGTLHVQGRKGGGLAVQVRIPA